MARILARTTIDMKKDIMAKCCLEIKIRRLKEFRIRIWIGLKLIKLATRIIGSDFKLLFDERGE